MQYFFNPRHLNVVLARGAESFSGSSSKPPDMAKYTAGGASEAAFDSSSVDEGANKAERKAQNEESQRAHKAEKAERKKRKKLDHTWRLVVAYKT